MTTVLTISALDVGLDKTVNYMKRVCKGFAVADGRTQIQVKYPATLDPTGTGSIATGAEKLNTLIRITSGPKIVLGYSQGAQVAGAWLRKYAYTPNSPNPDELSFILIGNPERKYGQQPWTKKTTPDDTRYKIRDVARRGDNWSDWQNTTDNRFAAMFGSTHLNYWNVDIYDPKAETRKIVGNTTYVVVP
ncbi:MAG: PE-PPE domain-containing protein [Fluviibacter sp.]